MSSSVGMSELKTAAELLRGAGYRVLPPYTPPLPPAKREGCWVVELSRTITRVETAYVVIKAASDMHAQGAVEDALHDDGTLQDDGEVARCLDSNGRWECQEEYGEATVEEVSQATVADDPDFLLDDDGELVQWDGEEEDEEDE